MKKLIFAAAIVCAAAFVHAASLEWSSWGYINDGSAESDWITGGQAYLVMVTDTSSFSVASDLTLTGGTVVDSIGLADGSTAGGSWAGAASTLENGKDYNFAIIFTTDGKAGSTMPTTGFYGVDANGETGGDFYSVKWNSDTGAYMAAFEGTAPDFADAFAGASINSKVESVPEPTSGLLLLLGVAGLALRRRRA